MTDKILVKKKKKRRKPPPKYLYMHWYNLNILILHKRGYINKLLYISK